MQRDEGRRDKRGDDDYEGRRSQSGETRVEQGMSCVRAGAVGEETRE